MPTYRAAHVLALLTAGACFSPVVAAVETSKPPPRVALSLTAPIERALDAVQRTPGAFPAVSAVVVQGDAAPWIHVRGVPRAGGGTQVNADTLFYIASQTKSFMGLLGAVLDRTGTLPLDTTLADIWPGLRLPAPADPRRITMEDLLSHQEGLTTDTLNFMTAYVGDVPAEDYPRWLETETAVGKRGFRYANLGDLVYGAALETRTGRSWHDWLDEAVLHPLRLDQGVVSRSSQVAPARIAWNHQWDGHAWRALAPKPDTLMHAAGGLLASADGMARWMQANLGLAESALVPADFERAQRPVVEATLSDGEINCGGYSLGWYVCTYKGRQALMHPGAYAGAVSVTVLVPDAHAGLSVSVNSDSAMEGFELEVMKAFIGLATGQEGETARLDAAVAAFPARLAGKIGKREKTLTDAREDASWGSWNWHPDATERLACTGRFHDGLFGTLALSQSGNGMVADIGARHLVLEPARTGLFAAFDGTVDAPDPMTCQPTADAIQWRGRTFKRLTTLRTPDQTH